MATQEYWAMFYYGGLLTICTKHRSLRAAERASCECESRGGAKHVIARIEWCRRNAKVENVTSHNKRKQTLKRSSAILFMEKKFTSDNTTKGCHAG